MIQVEGITKRYGHFEAVKDITFDVRDGEVVGFVGPNGAGKTTTIEISVGVKLPTSGDVKLDGYSITKDKVKASWTLGWVPEFPIFDPDMKALDYFLYVCGLRGLSSSEAKRLAKELFEEVGLSGQEGKKIRQYSQGMRKRLALAISMIHDPKNFFFDEVLNGLDPEGIKFFRDTALKFRKEGKAVLFSSHILSEVEALADRVVFISKGRVVKVMTMDEIRAMSRTKVFRVKFASETAASSMLESMKPFGNPRVDRNSILIEDFNGDIEGVARAVKGSPEFVEMGWVMRTLEDLFFEIVGERK
jgi:ABC-2 type transport system ATP-binding protein